MFDTSIRLFNRWFLGLGAVTLSFSSFSSASLAQEGLPEEPLHESYDKRDPGAWVLSGWKVVTSSSETGNQGSSLEVRGKPGFVTTIKTREGSQTLQQEGGKFVEFRVPNEESTIDIHVTDLRGATWSGSVDMTRNQRITLSIEALYEHRGYTGLVKNDLDGCKASQRKTLRFEVFQNGQPVKAAFDLDAGKSLPMLRLMQGDYVMRISEKRGSSWQERAARPFKSHLGWRFEEGCP